MSHATTAHAIGSTSRVADRWPDRRGRRAAAAVLVLSGVGLVSGGVLGAWNATSAMSTGSLDAASAGVDMLDANGGMFTAGVPNLLPGDYFHRYVDLRSSAAVDTEYTGVLTATGELATGLQARVDRCSVAWTTTAGTGTCSTGSASVAAAQALAAPVSINYGTIAPGAPGTVHLRYRFSLADGAPATLMGKAGTISASVSGTLVGGHDRTGG